MYSTFYHRMRINTLTITNHSYDDIIIIYILLVVYNNANSYIAQIDVCVNGGVYSTSTK